MPILREAGILLKNEINARNLNRAPQKL